MGTRVNVTSAPYRLFGRISKHLARLLFKNAQRGDTPDAYLATRRAEKFQELSSKFGEGCAGIDGNREEFARLPRSLQRERLLQSIKHLAAQRQEECLACAAVHSSLCTKRSGLESSESLSLSPTIRLLMVRLIEGI